jgi:GNAT superfamily N-acetyltransferase
VGDIEVRRAGPADLPVILELIEELDRLQRPWRVFPPRPSFGDELAARYRSALGDSGEIVLVAIEAGEVVGTAYGHVTTPSTVSDEPALELSGVMVRPSHRGRGIGRVLTEEVGRFARRAGVRMVTVKIFAQNDEAVRFWERVGFRHRMLQMVAPAESLDRHPERPPGEDEAGPS